MTYTPKILSIEELSETAAKMQVFLEEKPQDQEEGLIDRLELLQVLVAKSGKCLADARYWLDDKKNSSITLALKEAMAGDWSASVINKKIDALCRDEAHLVNSFDRINSASVHQIDALRTVISYRKAQMNL